MVASATNKVTSYDPENGNIIWESSGMTGNTIPTPVWGDGVVYVTSGFRGSALQAIKLDSKGNVKETDSILWSHDEGTPYVPSPLLHQGRLYFFQKNDNLLSCLDAKTGKVHYRQRVEGLRGVYASPIGVGEHIYLVGRRGTVVVIKSGDELEIVATNSLDEEFDASPAVVGNHLYLRGKQHLYCLAGTETAAAGQAEEAEEAPNQEDVSPAAEPAKAVAALAGKPRRQGAGRPEGQAVQQGADQHDTDQADGGDQHAANGRSERAGHLVGGDLEAHGLAHPVDTDRLDQHGPAQRVLEGPGDAGTERGGQQEPDIEPVEEGENEQAGIDQAQPAEQRREHDPPVDALGPGRQHAGQEQRRQPGKTGQGHEERRAGHDQREQTEGEKLEPAHDIDRQAGKPQASGNIIAQYDKWIVQTRAAPPAAIRLLPPLIGDSDRTARCKTVLAGA